MRQFLFLAGLILMLPVMTASAAPGLRISMLPNYAADVINLELHPLAGYLGGKTGRDFEVDLAVDFAQYEKRLKSGAVAVGYENPAMYVRVSERHEALAMAVTLEGRDKTRGLIITMKNSGIRTVADLRGKTVSMVSVTSANGFLSQKLTLNGAGIDVEKDLSLVEAVDNKSENVILAVYTGDADAGFVHEFALKEAGKYIPVSALEVVATCAWLPGWALSVDRRLPDREKKAIQAALMEIPSGHPALKALNIKGFRYASDEDYDSVRETLKPGATP
jgi:phosphonate transport system substrate-binding protein